MDTFDRLILTAFHFYIFKCIISLSRDRLREYYIPEELQVKEIGKIYSKIKSNIKLLNERAINGHKRLTKQCYFR